jgi:protein SHQ1
MPVTPTFSIYQERDFLVVVIGVPFVRVSDLEYIIDGASFSFWCKPYLLKLVLPGRLAEDERVSATYDPSQV